MSERLSLRLHAVTYAAADVRIFELRAADGRVLPAVEPGSHLLLHLRDGLDRSYSLINPDAAPACYRFAVHRHPESRGGSAYLFDTLRVGDGVEVSAPSNNFQLQTAAPMSVLIAGGIGITPLWSMIQALERCGARWQLFYAVRTRARAAFLDVLGACEAKRPGRVVTVFDEEPGQAMLDIGSVVAAQPAGTHFYCCGPSGMLKAFEQATSALPSEQVHVEYFSSDQAPAEGGFEVVLARSGTTLTVPEGATILETLLKNGRDDLPRSCMAGVCGTCETRVLEGEPDHRDNVLSDSERAAKDRMMICCSGSLGGRLVLDI